MNNSDSSLKDLKQRLNYFGLLDHSGVPPLPGYAIDYNAIAGTMKEIWEGIHAQTCQVAVNGLTPRSISGQIALQIADLERQRDITQRALAYLSAHQDNLVANQTWYPASTGEVTPDNTLPTDPFIHGVTFQYRPEQGSPDEKV